MAPSDTPTEDSGGNELVIYDFDPHNLPPEMLRAIGLVVAASSQTESVVQDLIGGLLRIDMIDAKALTTHMSAPLKDHVVRALSELRAPSPSEVDALDDLLDRINTAYEKRNLIVHNSLARHPDTGEVFSLREQARGSLKVSLQRVTASEFEAAAELIYRAGMDLMEFMMSRGLQPHLPEGPLREALDRRPKARALRRDRNGADRTGESSDKGSRGSNKKGQES